MVKTDPEVWVRGHMDSHVLDTVADLGAQRLAERFSGVVQEKKLKHFNKYVDTLLNLIKTGFLSAFTLCRGDFVNVQVMGILNTQTMKKIN